MGASCALWGDEQPPTPGLYPLDAVASSSRCENQKCLQIWPKVPWEAESPRGDPLTQRKGIPGRGNNKHEGPEVGTNSADFLGTEVSGSGSFQGNESSGVESREGGDEGRGRQGPNVMGRGWNAF